ncbi:SurA N-terminal domain-containing protein [Streptacidiphilus sp. ASG 303]|uniref:SurA N-terminal domain-containing protein n=1 Tax=Streptomycetaceae TaxID=2062 RepID=UPI001E375F85|nr:SurA N-terminal domain-containing protein [Streptacidiphilus sp. ASG 303]MCD0483898.1 SurA N-terminal domain-containing protein [Streptacidiphilus sp. ASG 303]
MIRIPVPDRPAAPARRRATAVAGAVLAAAALTACGGTANPGTAAVVGDHRITTSAVQARIVQWRDAAARENHGSAQAENGGLARNTVSDMVLSDLVAAALERHGLTVTPGEVEQARTADARQLGGEAALQRALLEQKGIAPEAADDFYRQVLGMRKLAGLSGQDIGTQQGAEAVRRELSGTARSLGVRVNPRYGAWDPRKAAFTDVSEDWIHDQGSLPS